MKHWYESIKSQISVPLLVTGYSLGGHLATAFNLMYPGVASKVVTFNGAGVGSRHGLGSLVGDAGKVARLGMASRVTGLRGSLDLAGNAHFRLVA